MKTPITLITGYLGAGKTTLLRHILDSADRKIAIVMNEFGQIGIDNQVIKGKNIDMIELMGGCVCCSLTGEFEAAINEIKEKINPELIIIETTGVAEPDAIASDIAENIEGVRLDAVVTVVDADSLLRFPSIGYTGRMQIEMADIMLFNKIDLLSDEDITRVENTVRTINSRAVLFRTMYCEIDTDMILDVRMDRKPVEMKEHKHDIHETGFDSFSYTSATELNKKSLEEFLMNLPSDIYRAKGFVVTDGGSFLMNFVAGRYDFEAFSAGKTQLIFIGKSIEKHKNQILESLRSCEIE